MHQKKDLQQNQNLELYYQYQNQYSTLIFNYWFNNKMLTQLGQLVQYLQRQLQQFTKSTLIYKQDSSFNLISTLMKQSQKQQQEMQEQSYVVFKYKRSINTQSLDQILIRSRKQIKRDPQFMHSNQQNNFNHASMMNKNGQLNKQFMLSNLFSKLDLQAQKKQARVAQIKQSSSQYFLKKINFGDQKVILNYLDQAQQNIKNYQKSARQQKFNKIRLNQQHKISKDNKRVHYKIVDLKKQNFVSFNGKLVQYQDLQNQQSQIEQFYVLRKGKVQKQLYKNGFSMYLPEQVQYLIEQEQAKNDIEEPMDGESEDSNREDRSDYDYPQQDYNSQNSGRSSEDLIQDGQKFHYQKEDSNQDNQDDQQIYRQYQKRCQKKKTGDSQLLYMYGLNPNKYNSSDDD